MIHRSAEMSIRWLWGQRKKIFKIRGNSISNSVCIYLYLEYRHMYKQRIYVIICLFLILIYHCNMFNMSFLFIFLFGCASLTFILIFSSYFFLCQFRSFLIQIYWIIITWIIWQMAFQTIALINSQCHQFHQVFNKATAITKRQNALIKKSINTEIYTQ